MDLQRRLSLHPNVVRFMGACCHIPHTGRPFQDDTLDNFPVWHLPPSMLCHVHLSPSALFLSGMHHSLEVTAACFPHTLRGVPQQVSVQTAVIHCAGMHSGLSATVPFEELEGSTPLCRMSPWPS